MSATVVAMKMGAALGRNSLGLASWGLPWQPRSCYHCETKWLRNTQCHCYAVPTNVLAQRHTEGPRSLNGSEGLTVSQSLTNMTKVDDAMIILMIIVLGMCADDTS